MFPRRIGITGNRGKDIWKSKLRSLYILISKKAMKVQLHFHRFSGINMM